jgi:hypothetical protein
MLVLSPFASRTRALQHSAVMVLGSEPVGERFVYWKFRVILEGLARAGGFGLESRKDVTPGC